MPVDHVGPAEADDAEYPLVATTGRVLQHYQSGAQTRLVAELTAAAGDMFVQVHPETAAAPGSTRATSPTSSAGAAAPAPPCASTTTCDPTSSSSPSTGAATARANSLTHAALDPTSRMPEFKACAVRLEAVA